MASKPRTTPPGSQLFHPIRIVPLHSPAGRAAPAVPPKLTYRNGPLLTSVQVFTIFWGAAWNHAPQNALTQELNQFFDFVLTSQLLDQLGEYSVPGKPIGHGKRIGTLTLTKPAPGRTLQDSKIQQVLQQGIASGTLPSATPDTLYFFFLPPGVKVVQGGSASCKVFCGYHDTVNSNLFYAVMLIPAVRDASVASRRLTRLLPPVRTSFAKPSPTPSRAKAGTTTTTAKLATFAPGKHASSATTPSSSNGPTPPTNVFDRLQAISGAQR
jgi:hypothetical protein